MSITPEQLKEIQDRVNARKSTPMLDRALAQVPQKEVRAKAIREPRPVEMNKTERRYALHLESLKRAGDIHSYRPHAIKIQLADACLYVPDFMVTDNDGYIEFHDVKAFFKNKNRVNIEDDALVKMKTVADKFPEFRIMAVWEEGGEWKRRVF